jgi:hypothetical protein
VQPPISSTGDPRQRAFAIAVTVFVTPGRPSPSRARAGPVSLRVRVRHVHRRALVAPVDDCGCPSLGRVVPDRLDVARPGARRSGRSRGPGGSARPRPRRRPGPRSGPACRSAACLLLLAHVSASLAASRVVP